jgi:hypothetical protein
MKPLTTLLAALGLVALAGGAWAQCHDAVYVPPDETAEAPIPVPPEVGS